MTTKRKQHLYMVKITQQAERFEDMLINVNAMIEQNPCLSISEISSLDVAYKNIVGTKKAVLRRLSSIQKKEGSRKSKNINLLKAYRQRIEGELIKICNQILGLLKQLINFALSSQVLITYYKMVGDYNRYLCQCTSGERQQIAQNNSQKAYRLGTERAEKDLKTTDPLRLGLALNYSIFFYQIKNDNKMGGIIGKKAFDEAIADLDLEQQLYRDKDVTRTLMQQIRDNLTLYTSCCCQGDQQ